MANVAFEGSQPTRPVGCYSYIVADERWEWSDEVYELHGFAPGEVPATTEVLLHHKHPNDRARAFEVIEASLVNGEPFSCYHRIIDRHEKVRSVLSVGRGVHGADGTLTQIDGFFVDLTEVRQTETEIEVEQAMARIAEHREAIDQAKGMVMFATGCDADAAFGLLRKYSQNANIKLHDVAHRLVEATGREVSAGYQVAALYDSLKNSVATRHVVS